MDVIGQAELTLRRFSDSGGIDHVSPEKLRAHLSKLAVKLGNASVEKLTFPFSVPWKSHPSGTSDAGLTIRDKGKSAQIEAEYERGGYSHLNARQ